MREDEAKRVPLGGEGAAKQRVKHEPISPRDHVTEEAVRKDQQSVEEIMNPGAPPDPGIEEDYAARSGEVPSQEPGNPERNKPVPST